MEMILAISIISAVCFISLAHWTRNRFEEKYGKPTRKEKWQTFFLFLLWLALFSVAMLAFPTRFGWVYFILVLLGVPFTWSKPSRKPGWRIQESGYLAFIVYAPVAYIYYFGD